METNPAQAAQVVSSIVTYITLNNIVTFAFIYLLISRLLGHRVFLPKSVEVPDEHEQSASE